MFDDEFIDSLPEDPIAAGKMMCNRFIELDSLLDSRDEIEDGKYYGYLAAFAALEAFCGKHGFNMPVPGLGEDRNSNVKIIRAFFISVNRILEKQAVHLIMAAAREHYALKFKSGFAYEFSEGDLKRIQTLLNELRDLITASKSFDEDHKRRVLMKLEALQKELHKRVSSLRHFWDLAGEAGVMLGKFGEDAKPFVDLIREIVQIVWLTQARAEELPSGTPIPLLSENKPRSDGD